MNIIINYILFKKKVYIIRNDLLLMLDKWTIINNNLSKKKIKS